MAASYIVGKTAGGVVQTVRTFGSAATGDLGVQTNYSGATGSAIPTIAGLMGGTDGGTMRAFAVTSGGLLKVDASGVALVGSKTNNNAAPGANNFGVLNAVANAAIQTWTEGNMVALSADLSGRVRASTLSTPATTPSVVQKTSADTNQTLLAANANRIGASIFNASTALLYVKLGTTASLTSYTVRISTNGYYELVDGYTGRIDGIWATAQGFAYVTELTP